MNIVKKLHNSARFPTSIIVKGANILGVEIARSLLEQGGYVIIIDSESNASRKLLDPLIQYKNLLVLDFTAIANLSSDLRRLDYIFYFEHKSSELTEKISTQRYLQNSNYLDLMLDLAAKYDAKFLLTTSIKAHQLNISNAQLDYNYGLNNQSRHAEYIELEIQRYAESLVHEYKEKVGINTRVLRLGEIIGRGTEFNQSSSLIKLIRDGLEARDLTVPGDGLEANYYIHYLDAAYGVLKAQFSASSKGKIFTLANPEEITVLSIAYKLLELLPSAREIRFDSDDDQYPPLILYKPAESLSTIGWKPRINFDRALIQTIEYVQELLIIEKALKKDTSLDLSGHKNMTEKIKDFFFVAENEDQESDAISKLIAERKKLEMVRTGNMVKANTGIMPNQKKKQNLSPLQRLDVFLHDTLFGFSRRISFLKNVTVTDFFVTMLLLGGFAVIYFMLISPLFSLSKNIFFTRVYFDRVSEAVAGLDFREAEENNKKLINNLESAQERIEDLHYLFSLTRKEDLYSDTQRFLESSIGYSQGYNDILTAYIPMQDFITDFDPKLTYRFGENKLLTAEDQGELKEELDLMYSQRGRVEDSLNRITKSKQESDIYAERLPEQFKKNLELRSSELDEKFAIAQFIADNYNHWPVLLGKDKPVNYLVVVQDNTRYSTAGGNIIGYIFFSVDKGSIKSLNTEVITTPEFDKNIVTENILSSINLVSSKDVDANNIEFADLTDISDSKLFLQTIETNYELTKKVVVDMVVSLNTSVLSRTLQTSGEINYQQINFNEDNLLNSINLLSGDNKANQRNEIMMNLLAKGITERFNNLHNSVLEIASVFSESGQNKDMQYYSGNPDLENFIRSVSGIAVVPSSEINFGMTSDTSIGDVINKFPISTLSGEISINKDYLTEVTLNLKLNSADNLRNGILCVSGGAQNVQNFAVTPDLVSATYSSDKVCNIFLKDEDLAYGMKYSTVQFANDENKQTIYMLRLIKNPGIESNYDLEFSFDPSLQVLPEDTNFVKEENKYIYSGILTSDKIFKFELTK